MKKLGLLVATLVLVVSSFFFNTASAAAEPTTANPIAAPVWSERLPFSNYPILAKNNSRLTAAGCFFGNYEDFSVISKQESVISEVLQFVLCNGQGYKE